MCGPKPRPRLRPWPRTVANKEAAPRSPRKQGGGPQASSCDPRSSLCYPESYGLAQSHAFAAVGCLGRIAPSLQLSGVRAGLGADPDRLGAPYSGLLVPASSPGSGEQPEIQDD